MAGSRFEYVRKFESTENCLLSTYIVIRIDGRGFHRFCDTNAFEKPNDIRALNLMNKAARDSMDEFSDIFLSYGQSDEYSFVLKRSTNFFKRRKSKLISCIVSYFTATYIKNWSQFFSKEIVGFPHFDARIVCYPTKKALRDYFSWRQVDCHINNLYNTCFWNLVKVKGLTTKDAKLKLDKTVSKDKNELLFKDFNINYNNEKPIFRKGTILIQSKTESFHKDLVKNDIFWEEEIFKISE